MKNLLFVMALVMLFSAPAAQAESDLGLRPLEHQIIEAGECWATCWDAGREHSSDIREHAYRVEEITAQMVADLIPEDHVQDFIGRHKLNQCSDLSQMSRHLLACSERCYLMIDIFEKDWPYAIGGQFEFEQRLGTILHRLWEVGLLVTGGDESPLANGPGRPYTHGGYFRDEVTNRPKFARQFREACDRLHDGRGTEWYHLSFWLF